MAEPHVVVAYYSQYGHTERVAEELAAALGATLEPIVSVDLRHGIFGFLLQGWSAIRGRPARLEPIRHDPAAADLVIVGSPVWANHLSTPVRAYLERYGRACKAVAFFVTLGGEQPDQALQDMAEACGRRPVAQLAIDEADYETGHEQAKIAELFARLIRTALRSGPPSLDVA